MDSYFRKIVFDVYPCWAVGSVMVLVRDTDSNTESRQKSCCFDESSVIHNPLRSYMEFPFNHPLGACGDRPGSRTRLSARGLPGSRPSRSHSLRGSRPRVCNKCRRAFYVMFVIVDFRGRR